MLTARQYLLFPSLWRCQSLLLVQRKLWQQRFYLGCSCRLGITDKVRVMYFDTAALTTDYRASVSERVSTVMENPGKKLS